MTKRAAEYREYIDAAADFSWSESGHTELKQFGSAVHERDASAATHVHDADAELKSLPLKSLPLKPLPIEPLPSKALDGAAPRRSTT